jgi:hypothetical protein
MKNDAPIVWRATRPVSNSPEPVATIAAIKASFIVSTRIIVIAPPGIADTRPVHVITSHTSSAIIGSVEPADLSG